MAGNRINVVLSLDTSAFTRAINRATRDMQRFGSKLEGIGRDLTARLTLPLAGVGVAAVKAFADFEKLTKGLEAIATEADPANKQLERLRKLALNPGISLEQAVAGSIRLQAVGQSAADAEKTLLQFSKAVALAGGTAEDLDVVTRQLSQIQSKGRILSEDFLVIAERVPAIGLALETAFGTKNIEAIRESGVSATDFVKRLTDGIANTQAFQKVTGGLANAFDNFKQSITASLVELGRTIDKSLNLTKIFDRLSGFVSGLVERFKNLDPQTQKFVVFAGAALAALGPLLVALGSFVKVLSFAGTGLTALLNPANLAIAAIGLFALAAFKAYNESAEFRTQVDRLWNEIKILGEQLRPVVEQVQNLIRDLNSGRGVFSLFTDGITDLTKALADLLGGVRALFSGGFNATNFRKAIGGLVDSSSLGRLAKFFNVDLSNKIQGVNNRPVVTGDRSVDINAPVTSTKAPSLPTVPQLPKDNPFKPLSDAAKKTFTDLEKEAKEYWVSRLPDLNQAGIERIIAQEDEKRKKLEDGAIEQLNQQRDTFLAGTEIALAGLDQFAQTAAQVQERFQPVAAFISGTLQEAFSGFFDTVLSGGQNAFKAFGDVLKKIVAQLIKAVVTALALAAIFSIISGGAGGAISKLGLSGKGFGGLFGGIFKGISGFAAGGLVSGPTLALVGEGAGTSRSNPEVIAPLDQLRALLGDVGGGGAFVASTRIAGDDLLLLVERAQRNRAR